MYNPFCAPITMGKNMELCCGQMRPKYKVLILHGTGVRHPHHKHFNYLLMDDLFFADVLWLVVHGLL